MSKISQLPLASTPFSPSDLFYVVQGTTGRRVAYSSLYEALSNDLAATLGSLNAIGLTNATNATIAATNAQLYRSDAQTASLLAQDWATKTTAPVSGTLYGARKYAQDAADAVAYIEASMFVKPSVSPLSSFVEIVARTTDSVFHDNVLTLRNDQVRTSANTGGLYNDNYQGNAAVRFCAPLSQGGAEFAAFGFSGKTNENAFAGGISYWEISNLSWTANPGYYPDAAIVITHAADCPDLPGTTYKAFEVNGQRGHIYLRANDNNRKLMWNADDASITTPGVLNLIQGSNFSTSGYLYARSTTAGQNGSLGFNGAAYLARYANDGKLAGGPGGEFYRSVGIVAFGGNHTNGSADNVLFAASVSGRLEGDFNSATDMPMGVVIRTGSAGVARGAINAQPGTPMAYFTSTGRLGLGLTTNAAAPLSTLGVAGGITVGNSWVDTVAAADGNIMASGRLGLNTQNLLAMINIVPANSSMSGLFVQRNAGTGVDTGWLAAFSSNQDKDGFSYTRESVGRIYMSVISGGPVFATDIDGSFKFKSGITSNDVNNGVLQFRIANTASAVNNLVTAGAVTGSAPSLSAEGSDTNIDLLVAAKGTGAVRSASPVVLTNSLTLPAPSVDAHAMRRQDVMYERIASVTPASGTVWVELALPSGYQTYFLNISEVAPTANANLIMQVSTDNGATWLGATDSHQISGIGSYGSGAQGYNFSSTAYFLTHQLAVGYFGSAQVHINPYTTTPSIQSEAYGLTPSINWSRSAWGGVCAATSRINRIRIAFASTTFANNTGKITLAGIR